MKFKRKKQQKTTSLRKIISAAKRVMKKSKSKHIDSLTRETLLAARREINGKRVIGNPRILKIPKMTGGFLQTVIPILSGLSALGTIAKAVADFKRASNSKKWRRTLH